jgi:hypothetical protein
MIRLLVIGLFLAAAAPPAAPGQGPEHFFVGRTEGVGVVHVIMSGRHAVHDRSHGRIERGGTLIIDQVVEEEGKPVRNRVWRLSRSGTNGITGSISDARGPVTGDVAGNVLHLRYRLVEGGVSVEQWITLQPGGRTAMNRMTFRRFGVSVATVQEVLRRVE